MALRPTFMVAAAALFVLTACKPPVPAAPTPTVSPTGGGLAPAAGTPSPAAPRPTGESIRVPPELSPVDPYPMPSPAAPLPAATTPPPTPLPSPAVGPNPVRPSTYQPYTVAAYQEARAAGRPILLYFYANWCPLCAPQEPINVSVMSSDEVAGWGIAGFRVNYNDSDTDADERALARELGVNYQHTFVTYNRAGSQVWKATGQLSREQLRARLEAIR